jgi:hypothetical protein
MKRLPDSLEYYDTYVRFRRVARPRRWYITYEWAGGKRREVDLDDVNDDNLWQEQDPIVKDPNRQQEDGVKRPRHQNNCNDND